MSGSSAGVVRESLLEARRCLELFLDDESTLTSVSALADLLAETFRRGGKVLVAGNGGSMADAMHFAEELTGRFRKDRPPLAAIALSDPTHLSCVANDYGFDFVFSRLVEAYAVEGDVVMVLSTSGNSKNLQEAARAARSRKAIVFGFLGGSGGQLLSLCDFAIIAPGFTSDRIQEIQMLCLHTVVEGVEAVLYPELS